jgi:hypothetical protein
MDKGWVRWVLKILLVYCLACTPDMWKLAMLGPPLSIATVIFILASSLAAPWVYLFRMIFGEPEYLGAFAPFAIIFAIGIAVVWWTERKRRAAQ